MKFPIGDILRAIISPATKLGKILGILKGSKIKVGDHEILLSHDERLGKKGTKFDKPHR